MLQEADKMRFACASTEKSEKTKVMSTSVTHQSVFLRGEGGGQCRDPLPPPRVIILYLLHECLVSNNLSESIEHYSRGNAWETPYEVMPCIHSGISYSGS